MMPTMRSACLFAGAFALAFAPGCGDDETTTTASVGPTGNPQLAIISPKDGACIAIGTEPDATIPIQIGVTGLYLRPPGACGVYEQCGHLVLRVNGLENNRGAAPLIDVQMRKLADRYADLTIAIEVIDDTGMAILSKPDKDAEAVPLVKSITLMTRASCGGGSGGAGGAGGAGGGAGGAGGGVGGAGGG